MLLYGAIRYGKYRRGWSAKLLGHVHVREKTGRRVWLHAVSVGEVNLAEGLINRLLIAAEQHHVGPLDVVVSTTTVTGFELAKKRFPAQTVFYCPFDFTWAIRNTLRRVRPDLIVLVELEIWPNWLRIARQQEIPVAVVNGRLSERSFRGYQRVRSLVRRTFSRLSLVAAQDATYAERFAQLGTPESQIHVTGSTKFDDAPLTRDTDQVRALRTLAGVGEDHLVFVAGSTQAGEEAIILKAYKQISGRFPHVRLIIVPRHAERFEAVAIEITQAGFDCRRRSKLVDVQIDFDWQAQQVLLVDTIGELRGWWGLADVAFVGGSLGNRGGQNMLEPSGYGAAVCFGPNTRNFRDIVSELLAHDAAQVVTDADSLAAFVSQMIESPELAKQHGGNAQQLVQRHQGAGARTTDLLLDLLSPVA